MSSSSSSPATVPPVEALLARAIARVNEGRRDHALALCRQAQAAHPPHAAVLQLLAWLALQGAEVDTACAQADASLALRPGHPPTLALAADAWFQQALRRQDAQDLAGAEAALHRVLQLRPAQVEAWINLGIVRQEAGRLDQAMQAYGRAYGLRDDSFGRIAHALANAGTGRLWLDLDALRRDLARAGR